jgi:peptidoglycan/xylan/chitin deacetylase (PgdA/CDA1 family)
MLAQQMQDPNSGSLPGRVAGMASRFIARQSRSKVLALNDIPPLVTFTFDDVPASACDLGAGILEQYAARGTFFVAGSGCGAAAADEPPRASIDKLRTVSENGHEIGCHTYSHSAIRYVSRDELGLELERNQTALKQIDPTIVLRNFAYPYGDLSIGTKRYLEGCFDSCRAGHPGINAGIADLGALDAWPLQNASIDRARTVELIAATVRTRGWLIFYSHDVADQPSQYGVTPDLLECAVRTAKQAGCVLASIADSLDLIGGRGQR